MRLLLVTPGRLPVPATQGGAVETLIDLLIRHNERTGDHELHVLTVGAPDPAAYAHTVFHTVRLGTLLTACGEHHWLPYRWIDRIFAEKGKKLLKSEHFDRVVVENELVNGRVFLPVAGKDLLYHAHNDTLKTEKDRAFLRACRVLTVSEFLTRRIREQTGSDNVLTVSNGVDTALFSPRPAQRQALRQHYRIPEGETVVVFSGRITAEKGILPLLEAVLSLPEHVTLLILGASFFAGSREDEFTRKVRETAWNHQDRLIFTGFVPHEQMPDYLAMADIGCVPSLWEEPFGLSAAEQMAMGLPVVATDSGALPEIVDERTGILVPREGDLPQALAHAIGILAADPALRHALGAAGRKKTQEKFSQEGFCKAWFRAVERGEMPHDRETEKQMDAAVSGDPVF